MCRWKPPLVLGVEPLKSASYSIVIFWPSRVTRVMHTHRGLLLILSVHCSSAGTADWVVVVPVGVLPGAPVVGPACPEPLFAPTALSANATPPATRSTASAAPADTSASLRRGLGVPEPGGGGG